MTKSYYDCIVVGGGHAGSEAAVALAKLGHKVLLITGNLDRLGHLSCNPAIGGLAKGHMVREIDALGGMMGIWADISGIQFRILNMSKGPAVRATRAQIDRSCYQIAVKNTLFNTRNLTLWQDIVTEILTENGKVLGIKTAQNLKFSSPNVLLTTGTFLNGIIHIGEVHLQGGRLGDAASTNLSQSLKDLGLELGRLKTGTTPRIAKSSIDYSSLDTQYGDNPLPQFSFYGEKPKLDQVTCHITWTNEQTHDLLRENFDKSPLFSGKITGIGARYCPSIEDKVARFPERNRHQIFLEPEGINNEEVYCNGISTSMPINVQYDMLHSIKGLENAIMLRPGYAIEYDYVKPTQAFSSLECKTIKGLWFAGQINGTSGYEEAAAQGLWAGLNISCRLKEIDPFILGRDTAYMAVLIDDLVTLGTEEPYRMFTSRAEYRLHLRDDNADRRLTPIGYKLGLINETQWKIFSKKIDNIKNLESLLNNEHIITNDNRQITLAESLRRPESTIEKLLYELNKQEKKHDLYNKLNNILENCDINTITNVQTDCKYAGYIEREAAIIARTKKLETTILPYDIDYAKIHGLSCEVEEKLKKIKPRTLGQASRISGVTPAAIACLEIHLHKLGLLHKKEQQNG